MKRFSIKNSIILIIIFSFIFIVSGLFFRIIYRNITNNNTTINIESVSNAVSSSIDTRFHSDYNLVKELIESIPSEYDTTEKQIAYLNDLLNNDKIPFFKSYDKTMSGFGKYGKYVYVHTDQFTGKEVTDTYNSSYQIDNIIYVGINAKSGEDEDPYEKQDFNIGNLVTEYELIINLNDGNTVNIINPFVNQEYLIYRFNEIICFLPATPYLKTVFENNASVKYDKYYIFGDDGKIVYYEGTLKNNIFYDLVSKENILKGLDLINTVKNLDKVNVTPRINLDGNQYYMAINKLFNATDNNLYVALFFTQESINVALRQITIPLIAMFALLDVAMIVASFIVYILSIRKNNQITQIQLYQGYQSIYRIKVNSRGRIIFMDANLKHLLLEPEKYKIIQDFNITNQKEVGDIANAIRYQKEIVVVFDKNETVEDKRLFIQFIPTKYYTHRILVGNNITEQEERNEVYHVLALYNDATKLPNQHVLNVDLQEEINEKRKDAMSIYQTYLVAFGIKDFINISTLFGSAMGNKVLKMVALKIEESLQEFDHKLYYYQDSIMMIAIKQIIEVDKLVNWIRETLIEFKKPVEIEENSIVLNLYFAYYKLNLVEAPELTPMEAIDNTIRTLQRVMNYAHKRFDEYDLSIGRFNTTEEVLVQDLRKAVTNHEFMMYLQPQYRISKEMIVGFEALIRWNNPKYKNQSTEHFIKVAEKNSLIVQIGRFVIDETFRMAKILEPYNIIISLNISPVQILQAGFVQEVINAAEKHQIEPKNIALEITETFLMTNFEMANEKLKILRRYGFSVHLDDFGTGYSSMLYLNELAIDIIKIDREFVRNVTTDVVSKTIITKIISLAKSLSIDVICEGVEEEKQMSFLSRNGCDLIQGYIISKPAPFDEMVELLKTYNGSDKPKPTGKKK